MRENRAVVAEMFNDGKKKREASIYDDIPA